MSTMTTDTARADIVSGRDEYTETVALQCLRDDGVHDVDDDATTDGDPCPACGSQSTTAVVVDLSGMIVRPYVPGPYRSEVLLTTTYFPPRQFERGGRIRVTGPQGTDSGEPLPTADVPTEEQHLWAARRYLVARHVAADLGPSTPTPGGNGYRYTVSVTA